MELTPPVVEEMAAEYREEHALAAVEADHVEMLPSMFAEGEFGWRDAVWVVRWYYRRSFGGIPNADRRAGEAAFEDNDFEDVRSVIQDVSRTRDVEFQLDRLTSLEGVDVPVASAFLGFVDPEAYLVVGEREWSVLEEAGELSRPYPSPPTAADYRSFLEAARDIAGRCGCDAWTLYQAIWQLSMRNGDDRTDA